MLERRRARPDQKSGGPPKRHAETSRKGLNKSECDLAWQEPYYRLGRTACQWRSGKQSLMENGRGLVRIWAEHHGFPSY